MDKLVKAKEWLIGCLSFLLSISYSIVGLILFNKKLMTSNYNLPWYLYGLIALSSILFIIFLFAPKGRNTNDSREDKVKLRKNKWIYICAVVVYVCFAVMAIVLYSYIGKGNVANIIDVCFGITGFILFGFIYFLNKTINYFLSRKGKIDDRCI